MTKRKPHRTDRAADEVPPFAGQDASSEPDDLADPGPEDPSGALQEAPSGGALVEAPEQAAARLTDELVELKDRYLRLAAEFDNFRKRTQRERGETWTRAQADVVANILDSLDDLGRVARLDPDQANPQDVLAGIELVERKLLRELEGAGLTRVGTEGEPFDPNHHEAVSTVVAPSPEQDHHVAAVLQPGYRFGGALLRPARVAVFVWRESAPVGDPGE